MASKGEGKVTTKWRALPTWLIVTLIILFFPVGLYLFWIQDRWSRALKKKVTWITVAVAVVVFVIALIFAPPTVTVTSSLSNVKAESYHLTGTIYPSGSLVTVNGVKADVNGDKFTEDIKLKEGDNNLKIVVISGSKRTEQIIKIHRYTKAEVAAQEKAAANTAKAKQEQAASAKAKADADAAAKAAKDKAAADASAKAKADAAAAASVTVSQKNAVNKAKQYLNYTAFSHDGLVDQLVYEQFSHDDAVYGADHSGADWNQQAAKKAKAYMDYSSFSRGSLIDQLEYDKFTPDQAAYGASSVGL